MKQEMSMMVVAIICAALLILGHIIIIETLAYYTWAQWTAGAIPFVLLLMAWGAVRYCRAKERAEERQQSHLH
ncbi:hypothetical protein BZG78_04375 [Salinivibrio sp. MA351]|jgi:amino acid transporter|uniref:hypothetical protein n=1 Tax=Salinivibrio TaxID=51366 RepID=UPI000395AFE0|nr:MULTISPECIES: hypothetical protein [Salinivibrio]NUY55605.1 hypothetical protein [Salinivibrio sp. EAGSL]OOE86784.1 hypothetical protein BZG75_15055 [Salinivibrio sp. AR640]OOE94401.1 hypothetical protein BZG76_01740 [Salinivibrio sp. AR647]OOF00460.1 hypothetical protein BZG78_04375 [Salinivibrio sp. MA351]OOF01552.1 hypothetical protein BZG80_15455 [Salinivibrio sp. MA440]